MKHIVKIEYIEDKYVVSYMDEVISTQTTLYKATKKLHAFIKSQGMTT